MTGLRTVWKSSHFVLKYSPRHLIPPVAARYIASEFHPLRPKILYMYANRSRETLWWRTTVNHLPLKRVVRSWCARRVRRAFWQALNERGYDAEGRLMSGTPGLQSGESKLKVGLRGTAEVIVLKGSVTESYSKVQQEVATLVSVLMRMVNNPPRSLRKSADTRRPVAITAQSHPA